jgi:hypothetical protein
MRNLCFTFQYIFRERIYPVTINISVVLTFSINRRQSYLSLRWLRSELLFPLLAELET